MGKALKNRSFSRSPMTFADASSGQNTPLMLVLQFPSSGELDSGATGGEKVLNVVYPEAAVASATGLEFPMPAWGKRRCINVGSGVEYSSATIVQVREVPFWRAIFVATQNDQLAKTGSGQTLEKLRHKAFVQAETNEQSGGGGGGGGGGAAAVGVASECSGHGTCELNRKDRTSA